MAAELRGMFYNAFSVSVSIKKGKHDVKIIRSKMQPKAVATLGALKKICGRYFCQEIKDGTLQ